MRHLRVPISLGVAAVALLGPRDGAAQGEAPRAPLPVAISITTIEACPAERFRDELRARLRRPIDTRERAPASLRIVVAPAAGSALEGTAYFSGASGKDSRAVRGSCAEISAVLAVVASTWLEAEPAVENALADPSAPAGASAPSGASAPADPNGPSAVTSPVGTTPSTTPVASSGPAPAPAGSSDASPSGPSSPRRLAFVAQGVVSVGVVGRPAPGGGVAVSYAPGPRSVELRAGIRAAFGGETVTAGSGRYVWVTAPLDGCLRVPTGVVSPVSACVRVEPGVFDARFAGTTHVLAWLGVGAGARLGWALAPSDRAVRVELEAFGVAAATGYRLTPTEATLVPFRSVSPAFAAGILVPFS